MHDPGARCSFADRRRHAYVGCLCRVRQSRSVSPYRLHNRWRQWLTWFLTDNSHEQCTVVSAFTENALYSLWQLIAYKYVCAASQLFFFQQLVSEVGFSVYSRVDRRTGKRIALIVSFAKCLISVKKTRRTDIAWRHIPYVSRGKNRHFYVPRPSVFVCPGDAFVAITQNVACESYWGVLCGANLWFGGFPYPVNPGRPEWSKVQTRGKPLVATAQAKYMSAGER